MKWAGHVARIGMRSAYRVSVVKERGHVEDLGVEGKIILIFMDCTDLAQDTDKWRAVVYAVMKCEKFIEQVRTC
jgi:hypothetical protein